ncbi:hypothetical protein F4805DRAFT_444317 [Annulohypoxylon moriforme]|nr:hypothetical protein F4805DRAFT_444317 [Annulohypoxylon moriforme]
MSSSSKYQYSTSYKITRYAISVSSNKRLELNLPASSYSASKKYYEQSYTPRDYVRSDTTISERYAGLSTRGTSSRFDNMKSHIKRFEHVFSKNSRA